MQASVPLVEVENKRLPPHSGKLGMWVFLTSDAVTFAALLVSSSLLRLWSSDWPTPSAVLNLPVVGIMTVFLLFGSIAIALALAALRRENQTRFVLCLLLTLLGGSVFLFLQAWEWSHLLQHGLTLTHNPWGASLFGASFYLLTGFHGCHVIAGIVYLALLLVNGLRGRYHAGNTHLVAIAGLYWYFVDVSWLFILLVIYLL